MKQAEMEACVCVCVYHVYIFVGSKNLKFTVLVGTNSRYEDKITIQTCLKAFLRLKMRF